MILNKHFVYIIIHQIWVYRSHRGPLMLYFSGLWIRILILRIQFQLYKTAMWLFNFIKKIILQRVCCNSHVPTTGILLLVSLNIHKHQFLILFTVKYVQYWNLIAGDCKGNGERKSVSSFISIDYWFMSMWKRKSDWIEHSNRFQPSFPLVQPEWKRNLIG